MRSLLAFRTPACGLLLLFLVLLFLAVSCKAQTGSTQHNVVYAASLPGADAGAQINAADTLLGPSTGSIVYDRPAPATASTVVNLSSNHALVLASPISWTGTITLPTGSSGQSISCPAVQTLAHAKQTNWISGSGISDFSLHDCHFNGTIASGASDVGLNLNASRRISVENNFVKDAQLIVTGSTATSFAAANASNSSSWISIQHNHGTILLGDQVPFILVTFTSNATISDNDANGYLFGVYWWGGDSCESGCAGGGNGDGAPANPRKASHMSITGNTIVAAASCIWGSMGQFLTIQGNTCSSTGGGDVGIDLEGTQDSVVSNNTVVGFPNGALAVFWAATRNLFIGNRISETNTAPFAIFNATSAPAGLSETFEGNLFTCSAACAPRLEAVEFLTLRGNQFTNVAIATGLNLSQIFIEGNTFNYSVPVSQAINISQFIAASNFGQAVVRDNNINSGARQGTKAAAILVAGSDFNAPQQTLIAGNILGGSAPFPIDIQCQANSGNSRAQANYCTIRDNILAANSIQTSAAASTAVVVSESNNSPRLTAHHTAALTASLTTAAVSSETVPLPGMTPQGHCSAPSPTNAAAAANIATTYISGKAEGAIKVNHAATSGMTFDITCTSF